MEKRKIDLPIMAALHARGEQPEYLYWVGCAGAFDQRYQKVSRAFTKILSFCNVSFAVLGTEETCNGDPARRAGNEMLFQMQALQVIETFSRYGVKKIITTCPHCYNTFKNEYPALGGHYQVIHHSQFLQQLSKTRQLRFKPSRFKQQTITFHDPCYLGRANYEYEAPRAVLRLLESQQKEMPRNRSHALCCGAGGAQMFKEAEKGEREIYAERTEEALNTGADIIATACPFCMTMLTDGLKYREKEDQVKNYDLAELIAMELKL